MKKDDIVRLVKRGVLGQEVMDNTTGLSKNIPYLVEYVTKDGSMIGIAGNVSLHKDHFEKCEVVDGMIQGINIFEIGDDVVLVKG